MRKVFLCTRGTWMVPFFLFLSLQKPLALPAQQQKTNLLTTVTAGDQYARNSFHEWLWGKHHRDVWSTPVEVGYLNLDSAGGGLRPVRMGGGNQSRTLHVKGANGQDYVIRSINKYYGQALPELYRGTFIEKVISDQASTLHPYAAFTITPMIEAAGIYHTNPRLVIIPDDPRLDSFRGRFANMLALFEERADDDERQANNFGNSEKVVNTEEMLEMITKDHDHRVDQLAYVKARIFDMFIGDWGRHEDQWRWATFKDGQNTIYKPIPRDRDQVYTKFDGALLKLALGAANLKHLQSFSYTIKDVAKYNFPARHLDRRLANEPSREQWISIAGELQSAMTDEVIRNAVMQMPGEAFKKSGEEIIGKLISRRDHLKEFAETYYAFLAEEVEIVGSDRSEIFNVESVGQGKVLVKMSDAAGSVKLYQREFNTSETKEIRLYGLKGEDSFTVNKGAILVRIIGGDGTDKIKTTSSEKLKNLKAYDTDYSYSTSLHGENTKPNFKVYEKKDSLKTEYRYDRFKYDKKGFKFKPGTTVGVGYSITKQKWGKSPYGWEQSLMFEWTFTRGGFAVVYRGQFNEVFGKWGLAPILRYDFPYVDHFFGIGNETKRLSDTTKNSFYRVHTKELLAGLGFNRQIDSHFIQLQPFYQSVEVDVKPGKYLDLFSGGVPLKDRGKKTFAGAELLYRYQKRNDPLTPTKGFGFSASGNYTSNLTDTNRHIMKYGGALWGYVPLVKNVTLALRVGGATIDGDPVFYQLNSLGGNMNLRGYVRRRFFGTTSAFNNNELRWLMNTKNRLFNGQIGLLAFFDQGRVWVDNETSSKWHYGYGGGLVIVPFKRAVLNGTVGFGDEKPVVHARVGFLF